MVSHRIYILILLFLTLGGQCVVGQPIANEKLAKVEIKEPRNRVEVLYGFSFPILETSSKILGQNLHAGYNFKVGYARHLIGLLGIRAVVGSGNMYEFNGQDYRKKTYFDHLFYGLGPELHTSLSDYTSLLFHFDLMQVNTRRTRISERFDSDGNRYINTEVLYDNKLGFNCGVGVKLSLRKGLKCLMYLDYQNLSNSFYTDPLLYFQGSMGVGYEF